jgi:hypothetical protein
MMFSKILQTQDELARILQLCLEVIESGQETVDSLLSRYPELWDTLRPPLEAAAWLYNHTHLWNPRPEFVDASRQRIVYHLYHERAGPPDILLFERQHIFCRNTWGRKIAVQPSIVFPLFILLFILNFKPAHPIKPSLPAGRLTQ